MGNSTTVIMGLKFCHRMLPAEGWFIPVLNGCSNWERELITAAILDDEMLYKGCTFLMDCDPGRSRFIFPRRMILLIFRHIGMLLSPQILEKLTFFHPLPTTVLEMRMDGTTVVPMVSVMGLNW